MDPETYVYLIGAIVALSSIIGLLAKGILKIYKKVTDQFAKQTDEMKNMVRDQVSAMQSVYEKQATFIKETTEKEMIAYDNIHKTLESISELIRMILIDFSEATKDHKDMKVEVQEVLARLEKMSIQISDLGKALEEIRNLAKQDKPLE
jgi:hypothetical protein